MRLLALLCLSLFTFHVAGEEKEAKKTIQFFAFGGVGFARTTSVGEEKFHQLLAKKEPTKQFEDWFKSGNDEAKMYCLLAFFHLDQERYKTAQKSDSWAGDSVFTAHGCLVGPESRNLLKKQIEKGHFEMYIPKTLLKTDDRK